MESKKSRIELKKIANCLKKIANCLKKIENELTLTANQNRNMEIFDKFADNMNTIRFKSEIGSQFFS